MHPAASSRASGQCSVNTRASIESLWMILHLSSKLVMIFQAENKRFQREKKKHYEREAKVKLFPQAFCSKINHHLFYLDLDFYFSHVSNIVFLGSPHKLQKVSHSQSSLPSSVRDWSLFFKSLLPGLLAPLLARSESFTQLPA